MGQPLSHPFWKAFGWTVLLGNTIGVVFGLVLLAEPQTQPQRAPIQPAPLSAVPEVQAVREEAERLKLQFEYWEKRATQMQFLLGLILVINSLYAIALAAGSYLNLKPLLESARRELDDLRRFVERAPKDTEDRIRDAEKKVAALLVESRASLTEFRSEIRSDLPTLQNMDKALRNILTEIRRHLPTDKDWAQPDYYATLSLAEREQIRYAELTVAGFKFFELGRVASFGNIVSEIYRGLGQFYGSYFLSSRAAPGGPDNSLFERSLLYFEEACGVQPGNAAAFKDIGVLYTRLGDDLYCRKLARQSFERSLQIDRTEPGALFGMGWLEYKDDQWELAIARYSALIDKQDWVEADRRKYLPDSYLNRACCRARSLTLPASADVLDLLIADCGDGVKAARTVGEWAAFRPRLTREFGPAGDLGLLEQQTPGRVQELLS